MRAKVADAVDAIVSHPVRRRLIEALWHSAESLSARRFHAEYLEGDVGLPTVGYHARVLIEKGIAGVHPDSHPDEPLIERSLVLSGPHSGEAVRRLRVT